MVSIGQQAMTKERMQQQIKAAFPFNPISGNEIYGKNLYRLQQAMDTFKWADPRFVTMAEAELNGWRVNRTSQSVTIKVRDRDYGTVDDVVLYNATDIVGMPTLEAMAAMTNDELKTLQVNGKAFDVKEEFGDDVLIAPARELKLVDEVEQVKTLNSVSENPQNAGTVDIKYTVMAKYWHGGLHNVRGIALAQRINEEIKKNCLEDDLKAIKLLVDSNPEARKYGLKAVSEEEYAKDPDYVANVAEPKALLNGAFVRDRNAAYRPKSGGNVVLQDNGDSLQLKSKNKDAYRAAIDLAIAKGWTAIELKGSKWAMPDLWLEAKLKGLDVVNYKPTEKDLKKFEDRLELQTGEIADDLRNRKVVEERKLEEQLTINNSSVEQPPIQSVTHSMAGAEGISEEINITYEVRYDLSGPQVGKFASASDAAKDFVKQPGFTMPTVVKMTVRGDGNINESMIAATSEKNGIFKKQIASNALDAAFARAFEAELEHEGLKPKVDHKSTSFSGLILDVDKERNLVKQKSGRLHSDVTYHSLSNLGFVPEKDKSLVIEYDKSGKGSLQKSHELEKAGHAR